MLGLTRMYYMQYMKVSKGAKIRNRYNQVPHLTQDTNGKVTNSQLDTTNESQEVSPFPAGDHKAHINRLAQRHNKYKTEKKIHKISTALELSGLGANLTLNFDVDQDTFGKVIKHKHDSQSESEIKTQCLRWGANHRPHDLQSESVMTFEERPFFMHHIWILRDDCLKFNESLFVLNVLKC